MTSSPKPREQSTAANESDTRSEKGSAPICRVCQQPIESDPPQRWRDELVHPDCGAELRCAVTLHAEE